jgi:hypothetical protein
MQKYQAILKTMELMFDGHMGEDYVSPEIELLDLVHEGVLCFSNERLEETEGEW